MGQKFFFKGQGASAVKPTFALLTSDWSNGLAQLDQNLTINSQTVAPTFVYKGQNATTGTWTATVGNNLTGGGSGGTVDLDTPLISSDEAVNGAGTRYWQAGDNNFGNITTEDMVVEMVFKHSNTGTQSIVSKEAGGTKGYLCFTQASGVLTFRLFDGTTVNVISAALTHNAWYHAIIFLDRSGSGQWYINGVASGSAGSISGAATSLSNTAYPLTLNARGDMSLIHDKDIAYIALWKQDAWLDTHLQATVAVERFAKLTGVYPEIAKGTAVPTVATRSTTGYLDKSDGTIRSLFLVGAHWMRICKRYDDLASAVTGYLPEDPVENKILQSEDFATTWSKINAPDTIDSNGATAPNGNATMDGIIADATDTDHGFSQAVTLANSTPYSFSVWAKAGDKSWLYLSDDTVANATCYFNLSSGAVGTAGAGAVGSIEDWGNGLYRCSILFTGTTASHTLKVQAANADSDKDFAGDAATTNVYFWGAQVEIGSKTTSYYPTTTVAATRSADVLRYKGDDGNVVNNQKGTVSCQILL